MTDQEYKLTQSGKGSNNTEEKDSFGSNSELFYRKDNSPIKKLMYFMNNQYSFNNFTQTIVQIPSTLFRYIKSLVFILN